MLRYLVVAALAVLSWITYVDRAAISSVKDPIIVEMGLNDKAMGAVFSAFALGYALGQIPAGWCADRFGPRLLLTVVVALWSLLTGLTGLVQTFVSLLVVRFLFGLAEAGAYPGTARAFYNWLPASEHGRANGAVFAASRIGAALAFPLMAKLLEHGSWRFTFYLLTIPGLIWAVFGTRSFANVRARNHLPQTLQYHSLRRYGLSRTGSRCFNTSLRTSRHSCACRG